MGTDRQPRPAPAVAPEDPAAAPSPGGWPAWLDVKKGRRWVGARIPGLVSVADGELRFTIVERRLGRKERLAIQRLPDPQALAQALGPEPLVLRAPLDADVLHFPSVPLLGRSTMRVRLPDHPELGIAFLDLGDPLSTSPYRLLLAALTGGPAARRRRDAVRDEVRAAMADARPPDRSQA